MTLRRPLLAVAVVMSVTAAARDESPTPISDDQFHRLYKMIRPAAGESPWMEIDWHPSVWEGRKKAAAEGKPIFLMAGSGGAPAAGC